MTRVSQIRDTKNHTKRVKSRRMKSRRRKPFSRRTRRKSRTRRLVGGEKDIFVITAFGSSLNKIKQDRIKNSLYKDQIEDAKNIKSGPDKYTDIVTTITKLRTEDHPNSMIDRISGDFSDIDELLERGKQGMLEKRVPLPIFREIIEIQDNITTPLSK